MAKLEHEEYLDELARSWHQTYKKSVTSLLILVSLRQKPLWSKEIMRAIAKKTDGQIELDEKSLHRALRRLLAQDLVVHTTDEGHKTGALRKVYSLTPLGKNYLTRIRRLHLNNL